jgi:hypothetical protein
MDTGATDHLTTNMGRLSTQERYQVRDQVQAANGAGMSTTHVGNSKLAGSPELRNILHVPAISKKILSVYRLVFDNNVFIEFHKYFFFVKTRSRRESSFAVEVGVDSIAPPFDRATSGCHASSSVKLSSHHWHQRLGHPSQNTVGTIVRSNNLVCSPNYDSSVCDAFQRAKSLLSCVYCTF